MARLLARFGPEHIRALVGEGRIENPELAEELVRVLQGRREKILRRWLLRLSSLTDPTVEPHAGGARLCLQDRAEEAGLGPAPAPAAVHWFSRATAARLTVQHEAGAAICAVLPEATAGLGVVDVETGRRQVRCGSTSTTARGSSAWSARDDLPPGRDVRFHPSTPGGHLLDERARAGSRAAGGRQAGGHHPSAHAASAQSPVTTTTLPGISTGPLANLALGTGVRRMTPVPASPIAE
jgi:hypothetical protein